MSHEFSAAQDRYLFALAAYTLSLERLAEFDKTLDYDSDPEAAMLKHVDYGESIGHSDVFQALVNAEDVLIQWAYETVKPRTQEECDAFDKLYSMSFYSSKEFRPKVRTKMIELCARLKV